MIQENILSFSSLCPFKINIKYIEIDCFAFENQNDSHIHGECEIYLNLTGDVSFMVENTIYPVSRGNAIITRPNEYHHCIYNSNAQHKHFWILFSSDGNENLLDIFFDRNAGEKNLIVLPKEKSEELISICFDIAKENLSEAEKLAYFFKMLMLLKEGQNEISALQSKALPNDVMIAIDYINKNISEKLSVKEIAAEAFVSVNTLERHFLETLHITPAEFIKSKRLTLAAEFLRNGTSVLNASIECGFCDCSHFITLFKKSFGMTPLKYKKLYAK